MGEDIAWKRKLVYRKLTDESIALDWTYISDHPLINLEAKIDGQEQNKRINVIKKLPSSLLPVWEMQATQYIKILNLN